jgi:hypothetical protein
MRPYEGHAKIIGTSGAQPFHCGKRAMYSYITCRKTTVMSRAAQRPVARSGYVEGSLSRSAPLPQRRTIWP